MTKMVGLEFDKKEIEKTALLLDTPITETLKKTFSKEELKKTWIWWVTIFLFVCSVIFYRLSNISPLRDYLVIGATCLLVIVIVFKFMK